MAKKQTKTIITDLLNSELKLRKEYATYLTEYAGSYYFYIGTSNEPLGVVEFRYSEVYGLGLHRYTPIQGLTTKSLIDSFDKVATTFNNSFGAR